MRKIVASLAVVAGLVSIPAYAEPVAPQPTESPAPAPSPTPAPTPSGTPDS